MMLVLSLRDCPGVLELSEMFSRMNLRFATGKFQTEIVYVFMMDGMHFSSYRKILALAEPFSPIDISRIAMNFHECTSIASKIA